MDVVSPHSMPLGMRLRAVMLQLQMAVCSLQCLGQERPEGSARHRCTPWVHATCKTTIVVRSVLTPVRGSGGIVPKHQGSLVGCDGR
jgi:hypothetical protein